MAELELITMGESASQAEFNNTSDFLTGAQKHHGWLLTVDCWLLMVDCWLLTVDGRVKRMKIARIICWPRDSALRPTSERGFDIIPAWLPELISETRLINRIASLGPASGINRASWMRVSAIDLQAVDLWTRREPMNLLTIFQKKNCTLHKNLLFTQIHN